MNHIESVWVSGVLFIGVLLIIVYLNGQDR